MTSLDQYLCGGYFLSRLVDPVRPGGRAITLGHDHTPRRFFPETWTLSWCKESPEHRIRSAQNFGIAESELDRVHAWADAAFGKAFGAWDLIFRIEDARAIARMFLSGAKDLELWGHGVRLRRAGWACASVRLVPGPNREVPARISDLTAGPGHHARSGTLSARSGAPPKVMCQRFTGCRSHALVSGMFDLWPSTLGRRRRPSIRVGLPWGASVAAWFVMARLAVDGRSFNGSWVYWLAVGGLVMPAAVVLASAVAGVWPNRRSVGASVMASLIGTFLGLLVLRVSREPMPFAILGGFVVSMLATGSYVVASSTDEVARRDLDDP